MESAEHPEARKYDPIVEAALRQAGLVPEQCRSETEGQWNIRKEQLEIWIDVIYIPHNQRSYLQIMAPICQEPQGREKEFYEELLENNYQLIDANFVLFNQGTYLKIMREIETMTPSDVLLALNRVGYYGGIFQQELLDKYKTKLIEHAEHESPHP